MPDLHGRVVILDKTNTIIAVLGHNPDSKKGRSYGIPQNQWVEGIFSGTHGSYWDKDGNLYVQDWNVSGRIMKLVRVKPTSPSNLDEPNPTSTDVVERRARGIARLAFKFRNRSTRNSAGRQKRSVGQFRNRR